MDKDYIFICKNLIINEICYKFGAQERTSYLLYLYFITMTYFWFEIEKRSQKRSWFVRYIRVTLWLAPRTEHWRCQCLRSAMRTKPTLDFPPSLTQHSLAGTAQEATQCSRFPWTSHSIEPETVESKPITRYDRSQLTKTRLSKGNRAVHSDGYGVHIMLATFVFPFVMFGTLCQELAAQPVIFLIDGCRIIPGYLLHLCARTR